VEYIGHIINEAGVCVDLEKIEAMKECFTQRLSKKFVDSLASLITTGKL